MEWKPILEMYEEIKLAYSKMGKAEKEAKENAAYVMAAIMIAAGPERPERTNEIKVTISK